MEVDVIYTPVEACGQRLNGRAVAVIDVFRATSCICTAMESGAKQLLALTTIDGSLAMRDKMVGAGERVLLGGERKTKIIEGFDLDNSPSSYARPVVKGATIVMSTTNGTRSVELAIEHGAAHIFIASLLNATAAAHRVAELGCDVALFCAGRQNLFTIEDVLCAGAMALIISENHTCQLTDSAFIAADLYRRYRDDLRGVLRHCTHYNAIIGNGLADDVAYCLQVDKYGSVPYVKDGIIVV